MAVPIRYNGVICKVRVLDNDPGFAHKGVKSPSSRRYGPEIDVIAQPNFGSREQDKLRRGAAGDVSDTVGKLVCSRAQLERDGWSPKIGDRVTKIADVVVDYIVEEVRYESPGPPLRLRRRARKHSIVMVELMRNDPARYTPQA